MLNEFSNEKIVSLLGSHSIWGRRACREILGRKDEFIPLLTGILDKMIAEGDPFKRDPDIYIPASLLLAQMRLPEVYPKLVSLISCDDSVIDSTWDDMICDIVPLMLRDTYNGDSTLLPALIENRSVSPWSRSAAARALGLHYCDGHISREYLCAFFRKLLRRVYSGSELKDARLVLTFILGDIQDHQLEELMDDVKAAYAKNLIDESVFGNFEMYRKDFGNPNPWPKDTHVDAIAELEARNWFTEEEEDSSTASGDEEFDDGDSISDLLKGSRRAAQIRTNR